ASLADAAIITVEVKRTMHAEISDAAEQFRRVCPVVLGVVALPRIDTTKDGAVIAKPSIVRPPSLVDSPLLRSETADTAETRVLKNVVNDGISDDIDPATQTVVTDTSTIVMQRVGIEASSTDGPTR